MAKQRLKSKIQLNKQTAEKSFLVVKGNNQLTNKNKYLKFS